MMHKASSKVAKHVLGGILRPPPQLPRFLSKSPNFTPKEISIPVPWGKVTGLHWNEKSSALPILCMHGWKDNASSFSTLIPELLSETSNYQFISIDLPGHGFSSHYPPGMIYQPTDALITILRIIRHFGWSEKKGVRIMGHSLGAIFGFLFTASHPKIVHSLIALDAMVPICTVGKADLTGILSKVTRGVLQIEDKLRGRSPKGAPKEELLERLVKSEVWGSIPREACEVLIDRAVVEFPSGSGKYKWSDDPFTAFIPMMEFGMDYVEHLAKSFDSNLLFIKAENGVTYISEEKKEKVQKWITEGKNKLIRYTFAEKGLHHVHLTEPKKVAPMILQFLSETQK